LPGRRSRIFISTEAGSEGRNFEFCHRLVLYDLPWKPSVVEQRIGRLDRVGRRIAVDIIYFRPASGIGADVVRLFERLGLFGEPMAGLEPQLTHIEGAVEAIALNPDVAVGCTGRAAHRRRAGPRTRIHEAAYQQLHRDPYRAELGASILAGVPAGLDALMEQVVVNAALKLGFHVEPVRGRRTYAIEFGSEAIVDSLRAVPGGSSFVGSFDREYAVADETIDFFASGHPRVEGLLVHFEENPKARVVRLEVHIPGPGGIRLVALYKDGPQFDVVALDVDGRARPEWAGALGCPSVRVLMLKTEDAAAHDWPALVTRLAAQLGTRRVAHDRGWVVLSQ